MKIKWINWLNLGIVPLAIFAAVLNFMCHDIVWGIFDILVAVLNSYAFLLAVNTWWAWNVKAKTDNKFIFTCPECGYKFTPFFFTWLFVPHIGSRRLFKCDNCGKIRYMKRK